MAAPLSKPIRFKTETNLDLIAAFSRPLDSLVVFGFPFFSPHDWSTEFVPLSEPIRFKIKTNLDLVAGVFPRSKQFGVYPHIPLQRLAGIMALIIRRPMRFSWVTNHEQCWLRHHIIVTKF